MLSTVLSSAVLGIDAYVIKVEVDLRSGMPHYSLVGLPDNAVKESRERVYAGIRNSGFKFPHKIITINLAPADIRKEGASLDLPLAIGLLAASGQVNSDKLDKFLILGELSLDGSLRPIKGGLPMAVMASQNNIEGVLVPKENANEFAMVKGLKVYAVSTMQEAVSVLNGDDAQTIPEVNLNEIFTNASQYEVDFFDVKGQDHVKRALEVAAAGGHNMVMIGPPGSGKTMLARRFPTILPRMTMEEALETTKIHSIVGNIGDDQPLVAVRPFRSPHHSISDAGLIGGGQFPRPGEVSLAHHGVLFLDELPEFKKNVLELLRQPLEDKVITIARASITLSYPATFMLVASMNPCPCGYLTDANHDCTCTPMQIQKYMGKISGPLLDRIDLHVEVPAVNYKELSAMPSGEPSEVIRQRVNHTRDMQQERYKKYKNIFCNAHIDAKEIRKYCEPDDDGKELLKTAITRLGLSARAYDRILKVSRTIADLAESEQILAEHVGEAIQYRSLDRNLWEQ